MRCCKCGGSAPVSVLISNDNEHHTHGDVLQKPSVGASGATSCHRLRTPGEGLRLGEALGLQHRDWHSGCGDTAFIEVVPRDHPHGVRVKGGGYRKLYVSAELDSLYGEYVWQLCEAGADLAAADL
jgi:hypothetical protein